MRRAIIILLFVGIAGCGSSPKTSFYALSVAPDGNDSGSAVAFPIQVVAVHIPPSLDRNEMVRKSKGESVSISDTDRWSAPLGEMIRNVLSQDLQGRLPKGKVILPDAPAPAGTASIVVTIADFSAAADGRVALDGSWSLLKANTNTPNLHRDFDLQTNGGSGADAVAGGMSSLLGELADDIASTLAAVHR
ncbi:MAG TPA: PqiC family protein [Rhizomicrobium sp.]